MSLTTLSEREWQILKLVAQGEGNKNVAKALCISENTVEHHLTRIYQKLGVTGRMAAGNWYWNDYHQKKNSGTPLLIFIILNCTIRLSTFHTYI